jgi:hypothetical protein
MEVQMSETMTKKAARSVLKKVDGVCVVYSDGSIRLDKVRLSYPWVGKAQKNVNERTGEETSSYSVSAMLPKETHRAAMEACVDAVKGLEKQMTAKGKGKGGKAFKYQTLKKFIKNGDAKDEDGESLFPNNPEYAGHWIVNARSPNQPQIRGAQRDVETGKPVRLTAEQAQKMIYGGCFATVLIRPWPQDNAYGIRANSELLAVQWQGKGTPFGNAHRLDEDDIDDSLDIDDSDTLSDDGGFGSDDEL